MGLKVRACVCDTCGHEEITKHGTPCRHCNRGILTEPFQLHVFSFIQKNTQEHMTVSIMVPVTGDHEQELRRYAHARLIEVDWKRGFVVESLEEYVQRAKE